MTINYRRIVCVRVLALVLSVILIVAAGYLLKMTAAWYRDALAGAVLVTSLFAYRDVQRERRKQGRQPK